MYSIVLTDGKIVNIIADVVEWGERTKTVRFLKGKRLVARINMDNVVGWIETNFMVKSEDWE